MPKLKIDGQELEVAPGTSVLQACEQLGIEVPRFCYHDRLSVPANCRMCLVDIKGMPKPAASCAMPCGDNMEVTTASAKVKRFRQDVMEMLLVNHPLDCPICDQGGECDLQDQAVGYGFDRGRYNESKRAVTEMELGPIVKTEMTRCIQCTRCIRFIDEIAGMPVLGGIGRGEHMEIDTYIEQGIASELSGNLVDVCPVGALTNKPYAFAARPWELKKTESVDVLDAVGSNIRVDSRGPQVLRVLPRLHEDVNEEWLADKSRNACDGLVRRRLDKPWLRRDGKLVPVSWPEALTAAAEKLGAVPGHRIAALAGDLVDVESAFAWRQLLNALGSFSLDCRPEGTHYETAQLSGIRMNSGIAGIEQADAILLIGTNPRREAPLVNARIRKAWLANGTKVSRIGQKADMTYPVAELGVSPAELDALESGAHPYSAVLKAAKNPMLIVGEGAFARADGLALHARLRKFAHTMGMVRDDWNGFNFLHRAGGRLGAILAGFTPGPGGRDLDAIHMAAESGEVSVVVLLGADEIDMSRLGSAFVIYQGHHGDAGAARADLILPGAAYTEKNATYVNTEGRVQQARLAVFPPGEAREDWRIVRALSEALNRPLPYDDAATLARHLVNAQPLIGQKDAVHDLPFAEFGLEGPVMDAPFGETIEDYYLTDPISRASPTMLECSAAFVTAPQKKTGTHG